MAWSPSFTPLPSLPFLFCVYLYAGSALAQTDDGGAASGVQPGDIGSGTDTQGSTDAGAAGPDTGSVNLSRGATIAIAVIVSIVVVLGITLAVLYFLAKKRQWKVKEGLRRSVRRVGSAVKAVATPLTPKNMSFPRTAKHRYPASLNGDQAARTPLSNSGRVSRSHDVEKGVPVSTVGVESTIDTDSVPSQDPSQSRREDGSGQKRKPKPPKVEIPSSSFEMDSPKTPVWKKVFGR